jgi:uncharacterized membrane protein
MALSVAVLVYFLNHIPSSIRITTVLEGIGRRLLKGVRKTYPEENTGRSAAKVPEGGTVLHAHDAGYVQLIDFDGLSEWAQERRLCVALEVRTGDFVHPGTPMARLIGGGAEPSDLSECFSLGATRTPEQDPQFLIDELVEIALRALSPGINDPFTAITAMHWLGAATTELGRRELVKRLSEKDEDTPRVYPLPDDFEHYVRRGFGAMRSAVAASHTAALVMFDTLRQAAAAIDDESRRRLLQEQGDRLIEQIRTQLKGPDLQDIEARYAGFSKAFA